MYIEYIFYNSYFHYDCSKYESKAEDATLRQVKTPDSSAWNCDPYGVETSGVSLGHDVKQNTSSRTFISPGSEASRIQKIIPSDCDVRKLEAPIMYLFPWRWMGGVKWLIAYEYNLFAPTLADRC